MVIGVPIFAVIYTGISSYINAKLVEKHLTLDTKKYVHVDFIDENDQFVKLPKSKVKRILSREAFKDLAKRTVDENKALEEQVLLENEEDSALYSAKNKTQKNNSKKK